MSVYYQSDVFAPEWCPSHINLDDVPQDGGEKLKKFLDKTLYPAFQEERARLFRLEQWGTGQQPEVKPLKRNTERAVLQRLARTPWIPLMISTFAQQMIVDGYRAEGSTENEEAWESWLRNKMSAQQLSINRATMIYGYSYVRVTLGDVAESDEEGNEKSKPMAIMRGIDPMNCFALYEDPYFDEYPQYVLEKLPNGKFRWWLPNGDYYSLTMKSGRFLVGALEETVYGTPPFVRYVDQIDLKGRCWGEVEGVIDLAARIDKTAFDRLMVQHFNSFKVRWATGLEQADTPEGVEQDKVRISNEDILIASDVQAKFGTLDETSMEGFIEAYRCDLEVFTAVLQLPPNLLGQVVNVAADALDGARRQTYQKLFEKQTVYGEAHAQVMRLAALIEGRKDDAEDFMARVHWQDVEIRSLAQFADAWGKMVEQLGVPKWAAWHKIPGVEQTEVEAWKKHALDDDPLSKYLREVVGVKPVAGPAGNGGPGGPNSAQNQRPLRNDTGTPRGSAVK